VETTLSGRKRDFRGTSISDFFNNIDVERALTNPIAASRNFTSKLLKYLLFQSCAYRRFTSYIAQ
jgi:hypothetical protein